MTKSYNAKHLIKQHPKELHPIAEEKMKCCQIISSEWLKKLEKSLKSPFSHIPSNFSQSIENLVDSNGRLLNNLRRGVDYDLVTCFMFDNLSQFSDKNHNKIPPQIFCGLGQDPKSGEDIVVFDLVAFNIKMVQRSKKSNSSTNLIKNKSGERWYASASWIFRDFFKQFCEVSDLNESSHLLYYDLNLENPVDLSLPISTHFKGTTKRPTACDLYYGSIIKSEPKGNSKKEARRSKLQNIFTNEKSILTSNKNESDSITTHNTELNDNFSKASTKSSQTNNNLNSTDPFLKTQNTKKETLEFSSILIDVKEKNKTKNKVGSINENSVVLEYKFSNSNNLDVPRISPVGFVNLTNTCYMNSVMQCFIRIPPISSLYYSNKYTQFINTANILSSRGNISNEFHNIINNLSSTHLNRDPYNISNFRTAFINKYDTFNSFDQQDAQEFLIYLIDGLHEDINQAFHNQNSRQKVLKTVSPNESPWDVCQKLNKSLIYKIFLGMTETKFTCQTCNHIETVKEPFVVLSLPLPSSGTRSANLDECLNNFCQKEILTNSEKIECQKCKRKTNSKRVLKIEKCGEILIIALKRFENSKKGGSSSFKKNDININYPRILNMNQFSSENLGKYKLIGCVYHHGGLEGGHYTSAAYDQFREAWYYFDDTSVNMSIEKNIHSNSAYILFYMKE